MQMLYNSDHYAVVQIEVPSREDGLASTSQPTRGGYEIVDKFARKEIFIEGALAESFKSGVQALIDTKEGPSEEALDEYIGRYTWLAHHPVVVH
jgi:hypothetical protein